MSESRPVGKSGISLRHTLYHVIFSLTVRLWRTAGARIRTNFFSHGRQNRAFTKMHQVGTNSLIYF